MVTEGSLALRAGAWPAWPSPAGPLIHAPVSEASAGGCWWGCRVESFLPRPRASCGEEPEATNATSLLPRFPADTEGPFGHRQPVQ